MKTQTNGKMFFEDHAWETVLERKVEKSRKKGFFKKNNIETRIIDFLISFEKKKTIFGRRPKTRLVEKNQEKK